MTPSSHSTQQSLKTVEALVVLDATNGSRVISKFYDTSPFATAKDQAAFETRLFDKTKKVPNSARSVCCVVVLVLLLAHAMPCNRRTHHARLSLGALQVEL